MLIAAQYDFSRAQIYALQFRPLELSPCLIREEALWQYQKPDRSRICDRPVRLYTYERHI